MRTLLTAIIWVFGFLIAMGSILALAVASFLYYIVPMVFVIPGRVIGWTEQGAEPCLKKR